MKKNLVYILAIVCIASVFVLSCDTKDDPPVPNHEITSINSTSSTSSTASTASSGSMSSYKLTIDGTVYILDTFVCGDDVTGYTMAAKNIATKDGIIIELGGGKPTTDKTYNVSVDDPLAGETQLSLIRNGTTLWECLQGTVSVTVSGGNIKASFSNLTFEGPTAADSSKVSCNTGCQ